jgi:hypothetical protein
MSEDTSRPAETSPLTLDCPKPYMVHQAKRMLRVMEDLAASLRSKDARVETTIGETGTWAVMGDQSDPLDDTWRPDRIKVMWGHSTAGSTSYIFVAAQWLRGNLSLEFHDVMPHPVMVPTKEDPFASLEAIVSGFRDLLDAPQGTDESNRGVALAAMERDGIDASGWVELHMPSPFGPAWVWTEQKTATLPDCGLQPSGSITASTYGTYWTPEPGFSAHSYFRSKKEWIIDGDEWLKSTGDWLKSQAA